MVSNNTQQTGLSTSYVKLTNWTSDGPTVGEITPDYTSDEITIGESGTYHISFYVSFFGSASTQFVFAPHIDGNIDCQMRSRVDTTATANEVVSTSFSGFYHLSDGEVLDVRVQTNASSKVITAKQAGLSVNLISRDAV